MYKYFFIAVCIAVVWTVLQRESTQEIQMAPPVQNSPGYSRSDQNPPRGPQNFSTDIAKGVHIVDFWAEWCGPCRMQAPILERFARSHAGVVNVSKVDVDAEGSLANKFGIRSIPTLIIFKDGREQARFVGVTSESQLAEAVQSLL